jgi:hypothetical protein
VAAAEDFEVVSDWPLLDSEVSDVCSSCSSCLRFFMGDAEDDIGGGGGGKDSRIFAFASNLAKLLIRILSAKSYLLSHRV